MTAVTGLVEQYSSRYHKALVARTALLAGLGSGCCAVLAWRLMALRVGPIRSVAIAAGLLIALFAALGVWLRKRWMPLHDAAAFLDQALGLKQRLVTAQEFAASDKQPPLYASLVRDLAAQVATRSAQTPRPWNHTTGLLMIALLLLLFWPQLNPILPPSLRQPQEPPQSPQPKDQPAGSPQEKRDQSQSNPQQQPAAGQQQSGQGKSSGADQQQSPSAGQQQKQESSSQGNNQQDSNQKPSGAAAQSGAPQQAGSNPSQKSPQSGAGADESSSQQSPENQPSAQGDPASADGGNQSSSSADQQQSGAQQEGSAAGSGADKAESKAAQGESADQQTSQENQQARNQQAASGGQKAQSAAQQKAGSKQGAQSSTGQKKESPDARDGSGPQGAGQSMGNGQEIKADIQKLLKEMAGELKDLQGQLDAAKDQPKPQAGSGTDPNLYGGSDKLDPLTASSPVPLELEADQKAADRSGKPAGGVGKKGSEGVSADLPQVQAQQAQLADKPLEENASTRQAVPVEYRSVFDQLRKREPQPAGGQKP